MTATIDREGRIALTPELQIRLGVKPGDDVILENRGEDWVLKAGPSLAGLQREGNVLIHCGVTNAADDSATDDIRNERFAQLCEGLPR